MTPRQCGSGLLTLQAQRLGREVGSFAPPDACRLTQSDWDHYMGATFEAQKVDTPKAHLAPPGPALTKIRLADLRRALLRQRNFKAHPQDTLPPEIWKTLARFYPGFLKTMDDTTLAVIRKTRTAPTLWSLSPIWPVPKHNGKQGLQGKRPVNGVHCFSRAFMRLSYKRPVPSPYVYGGVAGRRREEAVGAALNIKPRCIRSRHVLSVQTQRCPRSLHKRDAQIGNATSGGNTEGTRGGHPSTISMSTRF